MQSIDLTIAVLVEELYLISEPLSL